MSIENDYARRLSNQLKHASEHRHVATEPWQQAVGVMAFDVELRDRDGLPSGFIARVVVSVTPA